MVDAGRAGHPPHCLLRRGDIDPGPLAQRAAQRLEHPLRGARRPFPHPRGRGGPGRTYPPTRLLSGQPSALSTRCGRLAAHSPIAVNESHPASRAAIATAITHARVNRTPRRSRGSGSRASHRHSDTGEPGPGESTWAAVTDLTGNGATFGTETLAIPVLPGLRCSPPERHAAIRRTFRVCPVAHPAPRKHPPAPPRVHMRAITSAGAHPHVSHAK